MSEPRAPEPTVKLSEQLPDIQERMGIGKPKSEAPVTPAVHELVDVFRRQAHALEFGAESRMLSGAHATIAIAKAKAYRDAAEQLSAALSTRAPRPETALDDETLDDLARDIFAVLCEGEGEHTEELDRNLIKGKVRAYWAHLPRRAEAPPPPSGEYRERPIEQLRSVLSMLCHYVWHRQLRAGEHMWSIPADHERDFDCILGDAIRELEVRRRTEGGAPGSRDGWQAIAERIARQAHAGQTESSTGDDYIHHIERVVALVDGEDAKTVAWLHDVIEDTDVSYGELRRAGLPQHIITAVQLLTREDPYEYADYIEVIRGAAGSVHGDLALAVKVADLRDHLRPNCPSGLRARYEKALKRLGPAAPGSETK